MKDEHTRHEDLLKDPGIEAAIIIPNVLLLLVVVFYLLITKVGPDRVQALVVANDKTSAQIRSLERKLARDPQDRSAAFQLARLYLRAGQLPFSYDALRSAEQEGSRDPSFRGRLGMAYIEIGKNADGKRVLQEALEECSLRHCPAHVEARLSIFSQVADLIAARKINARTHPEKAAKVFNEVLKKVDSHVLSPLGRKKLQNKGTAPRKNAPKVVPQAEQKAVPAAPKVSSSPAKLHP